MLIPGFLPWDHMDPSQWCSTTCVTSSRKKGECHQTCHPSAQWPQCPKPLAVATGQSWSSGSQGCGTSLVGVPGFSSLSTEDAQPRTTQSPTLARKGEGCLHPAHPHCLGAPGCSSSLLVPAGHLPAPCSALWSHGPLRCGLSHGLRAPVSLVVKCPSRAYSISAESPEQTGW